MPGLVANAGIFREDLCADRLERVERKLDAVASQVSELTDLLLKHAAAQIVLGFSSEDVDKFFPKHGLDPHLSKLIVGHASGIFQPESELSPDRRLDKSLQQFPPPGRSCILPSESIIPWPRFCDGDLGVQPRTLVFDMAREDDSTFMLPCDVNCDTSESLTEQAADTWEGEVFDAAAALDKCDPTDVKGMLSVLFCQVHETRRELETAMRFSTEARE